MRITSPAFEDGAELPRRYTADGADVSPPLAWTGVPPGARSLALIVDDPDAPDPAAPKRTWVHWVVIDLPPTLAGVDEDVHELARGSFGLNDWGNAGWGGPSPPRGRHRYFFKLYALDGVLELDRPSKAAVERAMVGHVLAEASLVGTYQRAR